MSDRYDAVMDPWTVAHFRGEPVLFGFCTEHHRTGGESWMRSSELRWIRGDLGATRNTVYLLGKRLNPEMDELDQEGRLAYSILVDREADPIGERWLIACKVARWLGIDAPPLGDDAAVLAFLDRYKADYMRARGQEKELKKLILEQAGGAIAVHEAAWRLGVSEDEVVRMIRACELLAVKADGTIVVPVIQLDGNRVVRGIPELVSVFKEAGVWALTQWLYEHDPNLNCRPIDALRGDRPLDDVMHAAKADLGYPEYGG